MSFGPKPTSSSSNSADRRSPTQFGTSTKKPIRPKAQPQRSDSNNRIQQPKKVEKASSGKQNFQPTVPRKLTKQEEAEADAATKILLGSKHWPKQNTQQQPKLQKK